MRSADNIKNRIKNTKIKTNPEVNKAVLHDLHNRMDQADSVKANATQPNIWRLIMQSKISKFSAAAVLIAAAFISIQLIIPAKAYALQDTLEANRSIRWLKVRISDILSEETTWTTQLWLQCDQEGNINRLRHQSSTSGDFLGPVKVTINNGYSDVWLAEHNIRLLGHPYPDTLLAVDIAQLDPKVLFEDLLEQENLGHVIVRIDEPEKTTKPIMVNVSYPQDSLSGKIEKIFYIDQNTKLVTRLDKIHLTDNGRQLYQTWEFYDYNQPIDNEVFNLDSEVPANAETVDMQDIQLGIPQGDMTEEEITVEVARQFFEAVIDEDYEKAGQLYLGAPAPLVKKAVMGARLLKIISMDQPFQEVDPDSKSWKCSCVIISEFAGKYIELNVSKARVKPVPTQPDRWILCGTSITVTDAVDYINLSTDDANLDAVTYNDLVPGEFMRKWLVLGPLNYPVQEGIYFASKQGQQVAFDTDTIDTDNFSPKVTIDNVQHGWTILTSKTGTVDLRQLNSDKNDLQIAYLWAQIEMPAEKTCTLGIGSDDGVKIWLNGELVHQKWLYRGIVPDDDRIQVIFKKGTNNLVLKIQNSLWGWGFCCRLLEE